MCLYLEHDKYGLVQPDLRPVKESGELYVLRKEFTFWWNGHLVIIPEGFRLDGASVPKIFWSVFFTKDGMHRAAALIHDYLYECKGRLPDGRTYTRDQADKVFYTLLGRYGVKKWQRKAAYLAVQMFGKSYWNN